MKYRKLITIIGLYFLVLIPLIIIDYKNEYASNQPEQPVSTQPEDNHVPDEPDSNSGSTPNSEDDSESNSASNSENDTDSNNETNSEEKESDSENEDSNQQNDSSSNDSNEGTENDNDNEGEIVWGVDSASYTDENMYQCVRDNFGNPKIWGRYLGDIDGVSFGIDQEEVDYLHENDIQLLVIYNHISDATGYDHGVEHAEQAISMAEDLGVPSDVALFGDIEPSFPVDSDFIQGWYDTLSSSKYEVGLYGVYDEASDLFAAYNATNEEAQENTIVWTAYPQEEITTQDNAPEFNPKGPENSLLYGWQYAIDAEECNIDTNLFKSEIFDYLW